LLGCDFWELNQANTIRPGGRIKSTVGEYCDDWIMVGKRCDTEDKIIIGTTDKGWGELKPVYSYIQQWKKENNIEEAK